jgi:hypothetical protein
MVFIGGYNISGIPGIRKKNRCNMALELGWILIAGKNW